MKNINLFNTVTIILLIFFTIQIGRIIEKETNKTENSIFDIEHIEIQENYKASDGIIDIWTGNSQYMYENGKITLIQKWETN